MDHKVSKGQVGRSSGNCNAYLQGMGTSRQERGQTGVNLSWEEINYEGMIQSLE